MTFKQTNCAPDLNISRDVNLMFLFRDKKNAIARRMFPRYFSAAMDHEK